MERRERAKTAVRPGATDEFMEEDVPRNKRQQLEFMMERCGMKITISQLYLYCGIAALVCGGIGIVLKSVVLCAILAAVGASAPLLYVRNKYRKHHEKLLGQLPDAFELMSRVMRSGQTVSQAIQAVGDELTPPVSAEFMYCHEQMNLGLSTESALRELRRRTSLLEIKIFVLAVLVHRQTGGNLAELLEKLAIVVRERFRIRGKIKSLTAQGRFQAGILLALPPCMFLLLMVLHPEYEMTLLQFPAMIAAAVGLMLVGMLWIRRVVSFEF